MKKTVYSGNKKNLGVSPVIGVILMVAISVVLAVSLYMMLPHVSQSMENEPAVTFVSHKNNGNNWTLEVVTERPINPINIKYALIDKNGSVIVSGAQFPTNSSIEDDNGIKWIDYNGDGKLSTNDEIEINGSKIGIKSGTTFKITAGAMGYCELPY